MILLAEKSHIPGIMKLLSQVLEVHCKIRPDLFINNTTKYTAEDLETIISDPRAPVFVCVSESGQVMGHAFCQLKDISGHANLVPMKTMYIDDICVDENCRGRHVATRLYEHVKDYAKSVGCHNITLCVWEGNSPARSFYEKMGMGIQKTVMETILD